MEPEKKPLKVELEIPFDHGTFASFYGEMLGIGIQEYLEKVLVKGIEETRDKVNALPFTSYEMLEQRVEEGFPKVKK